MKKLDPSFYDNKTNLVNLSNSILKHFGVEPFHPSIPEVDEVLKGHDKVLVFLFDGAGEAILNRWKWQTRFMREHKLMTIHSVNPATTVACTTAFLTGRYPIETGWLGWSLYFKELGYPVDVFTNENSLTGEVLPGENIMAKKCPIKYIHTILNEHGVKATCLLRKPLWDGLGPDNLEECITKTEDAFKSGSKFVYTYWTEPDKFIHEYGVDHKIIKKNMSDINKTIKEFVKRNPDVLVLSIADHGLINVQYRDLVAFKEIDECLDKPISLEGRTPNFFIKKGYEEQFVAAMSKRMPDLFLMSKQEAIDSHYFGEGTPSEASLEFLGDYIGVSLNKDVINDTRLNNNITVHEGHHAGGTVEEREVLLAAYNR